MTCSVEWDYTWHCTVVYRIVHSSLQVLLLPPIIQRQLGTLKCVYQWFQVWTVVSFCSCDKLATCAGCKPAFGWRHLGLTPTTPASLSPGEVLIVNADPQHQSLPCVFFFPLRACDIVQDLSVDISRTNLSKVRCTTSEKEEDAAEALQIYQVLTDGLQPRIATNTPYTVIFHSLPRLWSSLLARKM